MKENPPGKIVHATNSGWEGIPVEGYVPGKIAGVERHTIVGSRKTDRAEAGPAIELRYFELERGAASRLERHEHEHIVIVKCGKGYAVLDGAANEIAENDIVYVAPAQLHQFVNRGEEPFGFYCIVEAARDVSQPPSDEDLRRLQSSAAGKVARPNFG